MRSIVTVVVTAILLLITVSPAAAVIKKLTPLAEVLDTPNIVLAEVDSVLPDKPAVTFKTIEALKGKSPAEKFVINLTGDNFAKKDKHTQVMLERLAAGRKLVLFVAPVEDDFVVFGYMEGTWFQMRGSTTDKKTVWAFLHCEPYFRRTFKGTTEELRKTIVDCLAGKAKPPAPDEKEPHGYGPVPGKKDGQSQESPKGESKSSDAGNLNGRQQPAGFVSGGPLFGVIPSVVLVGPLAILSALFPSVFAGFASGLKRWRGFLMIASANSLLTGGYVLLGQMTRLPDSVWFSPTAITILVVLVNIVGVAWAGLRYRRAALEDASVTLPPARSELIALTVFLVVLIGILFLLAWLFGLSKQDVVSMPTREFTAIAVGLAHGLVYAIYRIATRGVDAGSTSLLKMSAPGEAVAIAGMFTFTLGLLIYEWPRELASRAVQVDAGDAAANTAVGPKLIDAGIWYEESEANQLFSGLEVTPDRVIFGCTGTTGVSTRGYVIAVDRGSGPQQPVKRVWKYTDKNLQTVYSTPALVGNRVYVGEGLHTDSDCRLLCLDTATGQKVWEQKTTSHTEGTPVVVGGKVYHSAGDDGIYCRDANTGQEVWHCRGLEQKLHVDTPVVVAKGKLYAGSGYNTTAAFCLDAATGKELWRKEFPLRSFGTPLLLGKHIVYGLGTGNLTEDLSTEDESGKPKETKPAGRVVCLDVDNGNEIWGYDLPKSVHTNLSVDARSIFACCKDGTLVALDRSNGKKIWSIPLGIEFTCGPVAATVAKGAATVALYAATRDGVVYCLDPYTGRVYWSRSIQQAAGRKGEVLATPVISSTSADGGTRELLVPATLTNASGQTRPALVRFVDEIRE